MYLDCNGLEWIKERKNIKGLNIVDKSEYGYILEVDVKKKEL